MSVHAAVDLWQLAHPAGDDANVLAAVQAQRGGPHEPRDGVQRQGVDHTGMRRLNSHRPDFCCRRILQCAGGVVRRRRPQLMRGELIEDEDQYDSGQDC